MSPYKSEDTGGTTQTELNRQAVAQAQLAIDHYREHCWHVMKTERPR
jgi:hypothetical protein